MDEKLHRSTSQRIPHYSLISNEEITSKINPVTGRSAFFGLRPWRCADRFEDATLSVMSHPFQTPHALRLLFQCAQSKVGEEPTEHYTALKKTNVVYYVDRAANNMIRPTMWERSSFDPNELQRIYSEDNARMHLWKTQKRLEAEGKAGLLDQWMVSNIETHTERKKKASPT